LPSITFHVDDDERTDLVRRADREKVNLSDYIRVRLGLHGHGDEGGGELDVDPEHEQGMRDTLADHERRLSALENLTRRN
jgi:hypothetical protein